MIIFYVSIGKYNEAIEFDYRRQSEWAPIMWHFWIMLCIASSIFTMQLVRDMIAEFYHLTTGKELFEKESENGY